MAKKQFGFNKGFGAPAVPQLKRYWLWLNDVDGEPLDEPLTLWVRRSQPRKDAAKFCIEYLRRLSPLVHELLLTDGPTPEPQNGDCVVGRFSRSPFHDLGLPSIKVPV